jgi:hypothetical protein
MDVNRVQMGTPMCGTVLPFLLEPAPPPPLASESQALTNVEAEEQGAPAEMQLTLALSPRRPRNNVVFDHAHVTRMGGAVHSRFAL